MSDFKFNHQNILDSAPPEAVAEINDMSNLYTYEKGQVIIAEGEENTIVGNVVEGIVKISNAFTDGRQQILGLLFPTDFLGRVYQKRIRFSYEAVTDVRVCMISRYKFEDILSRFPEVEHQMLVAALSEIDAMREWIALIYCRTSMQRIATFLYILMQRLPNQGDRGRSESGNPVITLPMGRRDVAEYLGFRPETLSRCIQTLARKNIINVVNPSQFELLDIARLIHYADGVLGEAHESFGTLAILP
jgi:CRP/FNR family transcriptional regulator